MQTQFDLQLEIRMLQHHIFRILIGVSLGILAEGKFCGRVVKSSCPDGEIHPWNKRNVSQELKSWLQSLRHDDDSISAVKGKDILDTTAKIFRIFPFLVLKNSR